MKRKLVKLFVLCITLVVSPLYSQDYDISLDYEYLRHNFVFESWGSPTLDGEGGGSRLIYKSIHRQPSLSASYAASRYELTFRFTPRAFTQSSRVEDIDFSCTYCRRYGPQVDLKKLTIDDRMERNIIHDQEIWSHSYTENVGVSYTATSISASFFPFVKSDKNKGLFFRGSLLQSFIMYKIHDYWNPRYSGIDLYVPGLIAMVKKRNLSIEASLGYREKFNEWLTVEGGIGTIGGKDIIDNEYKLRWVDMEYYGYGSGFFWSANFVAGLNDRLSAYVKLTQKHYFGNVEKVEGIHFQGGPGDPFFIGSSVSDENYATRTSHFQFGMTYDL